ncbi:hypothetical protein SAMN05421748_12230 [Paractinoplanes atraurantiacus]|uniref:Uncharacterized protein n=2 Tax=Paractinoplanes atraurantiacus TaxID=1036182 RepID=A0A285JKW2_9ACTN|nr:hypothetical protein SAMN05421748_12230 [Actinoplanes atraurantiacus]
MTGVLAGFAFAALVLILAPGSGSTRTPSWSAGASLTLLSALIALIVTTLLYSLLAGEDMEAARARAATVELIDGLAFGLAVVALFQGVAVLMRRAGVDPVAARAARVAGVVVFPALAMYFVAQGAADTEAMRAAFRGEPCVAAIPPLGAGLTVALGLVLAVSLTSRVQAVMAAYAERCRVWAPILVILASGVAALVAGDLGTRSPTLLLSPRALDVFLAVSALLLGAVGLMFSASGATAPDADIIEDFPKEPAIPRRR